MTIKEATGKNPCGFCSTGHHTLCPGSVKCGSLAPVQIIVCPCSAQGHTLGGPHRQPNIIRLTKSARPVPGTPSIPAANCTEVTAEQADHGKKTSKAVFPPGVLSPYHFRRLLVDKGVEPVSFRPQTVYTWVTQAAKGTGTFPVRYYTADGIETTPDADGARPGVPVDDGIAWHTTRSAGTQPVKSPDPRAA